MNLAELARHPAAGHKHIDLSPQSGTAARVKKPTGAGGICLQSSRKCDHPNGGARVARSYRTVDNANSWLVAAHAGAVFGRTSGARGDPLAQAIWLKAA